MNNIMQDTASDIQYLGLVDYPGYLVGSDGTIWSYWKPKPNGGKQGGFSPITGPTPKQLKPHYGKGRNLNYLTIWLHNKSHKRVYLRIHRPILEAFSGYRPPGLEARHLNGNSFDNAISNLKWGTAVDNSADRVIHGTQVRGSKDSQTKLTEANVLAIRSSNKSQRKLAKQYGVSQGAIHQVMNRITWTHI